jgi:hypothetical protein
VLTLSGFAAISGQEFRQVDERDPVLIVADGNADELGWNLRRICQPRAGRWALFGGHGRMGIDRCA